MTQDDDVRFAKLAKPEPPLFGDVLLESQAGFRKSRGPATATSFVLLTTIFVTMALIPLIFPEALPRQQLLTTLIAPPPPPPPPPAPAAAPQVAKAIAHSEVLTNSQLQAPSAIPKKIGMIKEDPQPENSGTGVVGGVPGGIPGGQLGGVIGGIVSSVPAVNTIPKLADSSPNKPVRVSKGISEGMRIYHPAPEYPKLALAAHIQGQVLLRAIISRDGHIENLQALNGHPLLVPIAIRTVQTWRYRPYLLNGEPVEVETEITVNFMLSAG